MKERVKEHPVWRLEQMVNFGLGGEKISEVEFKKYWGVVQIDPARRKFLTVLLDENSGSHTCIEEEKNTANEWSLRLRVPLDFS